MKVKTKKGIFDIRWQRVQSDKFRALDGKKCVTTICSLSKVDETKKGRERYIPIKETKAYQSPKDCHVKAVGRKVAMTRVLRYFEEREDRKVFWDTYLKKCRL